MYYYYHNYEMLTRQWRSQARGDGGADSADMRTPQNARQC